MTENSVLHVLDELITALVVKREDTKGGLEILIGNLVDFWLKSLLEGLPHPEAIIKAHSRLVIL